MMQLLKSTSRGPDLESVPENVFWAKLDSARGAYHPLHCHAADVGAVFARLIAPDSPLAKRLASALGLVALGDDARRALTYLALLHDIGKCNHGFQEQRDPVGRRPSRPARGHVTVLLKSHGLHELDAEITDILSPLGLSPDDENDLFTATISHHGRPWPVSIALDRKLYPLWLRTPLSPRDPIAEVRRLGRLARAWVGLSQHPELDPLATTAAATHLFAGILTLADWIGSTEAAFPYAPGADADEYWQEATQKADRACREIGVVPQRVRIGMPGSALLPHVFPTIFRDRRRRPTPLQNLTAQMPLPKPGERLLIESETGSGKTEAALTLYARIREADEVGGLLFLLPTRATAKAMYDRICAAIPGIYGAHGVPTLALATGGQKPLATANTKILETQPLIYNDDDTTPAHEVLGTWASERSKRFFAAEIVVGTLDQFLLAGIPVRHAHLRLAAATRHLIVIDEVHSYDRYMTRILAGLLDLHAEHGGLAVLMSATLSEDARSHYCPQEVPLPLEGAIRRPFPAISSWRPHAESIQSDDCLQDGRDAKRIYWSAYGEDDWIDHAVQVARLGGRVAVVRNTVGGARATVKRLRELGYESLLWAPKPGATPAYQSRFAAVDRRVLDEKVIAGFGPGGDSQGCILVATQVIEQSLDVDFDYMITDLCPIDVLLQRAGRLHRHDDRHPLRPALCRNAQMHVIVPEAETLEAHIANGRGPNGWGTVYENLADLELTLGLLKRASIEIPNDNRLLVESVYHEEARSALERSTVWSAYMLRMDGRALSTSAYGGDVAIRFDRSYAECANQFEMAQEAKLRTRLGDDLRRIDLPERVPARYASGEFVATVDIPDRYVASLPAVAIEQGIHDWRQSTDGVSFRLGDLTIRYSDDGLSWERATP